MAIVTMDRLGTTGESLDARIDAAADREDARRRADRVLAAIRAAGHTAPLSGAEAHILGLAAARAPYLATLLARDPARLGRTAADPYLRREKPGEVLVAQLAAATAGVVTAADLARALRRVRADELVRLGVRELELGEGTEVGRELARLAGACFDAALRFHDAALRARFGPPRERQDDGRERDATMVVIGMGKLGGDELNFSSDVDVIYVYSSDQGAAGALSLHEYFAKLAAAVSAAVGEVTEDDIVFRVDLRLRPEGSQGAIANALAQLERYYETFGRPWERQAWLKAQPCAGDRALGAEVMETMRPFVYPRHTSSTVVAEVLELNRRIKRELLPDPVRSPSTAAAARRATEPATHGAARALMVARAARQKGEAAPAPAARDAYAIVDLKNGVGGIREIEFFVQAHQLVHARNPTLRARGTLGALDQLLFAGLVTDDEHLALWRAYRWLRHVEHVLQLDSGRQTQRVPAEPTARLLVARRVGYPTIAAFEAELARHTGAVAALFATLGAPEHADDDGPTRAARAVLTGDLGPAAHPALAALGFADPAAAAAELGRARLRPDSPLGDAQTGALTRLGPALLAEIATSADPDRALRHAVDLGGRRAAAWSVWQLLDANRPLLRLLVSILGASEYLARSLVDRPELIDLLVAVDGAPSREEVQGDADRRLAVAHAADPGDEELAWSALAEHKNGQVLRIALADFAGRLDALAVCTELTTVAEICLERALALVMAGMRARHGVPRAADGAPTTLAILALGKLGGRELGYAADLDVVFVYGDDGASDGARPLDNVEYFTRAAQRLMTALHARTPRGRLYELDTRLRPAGSQGLLVSSLAAWRRYHAHDAQRWEQQALTRLRPVAGDGALGEAAARAAAAAVWAPHPPRGIADAIAEMRERIERELGSRGDLKAGKGGVIDVEFAAQCLQLAHGAAHPALRTPSTIAALAAAAAADVVDPGDAALLADGYRFLRRLEHRLRIVHDRPVHHLPEAPVELERLARRAGFPDGPRLARAVERWRDEIRAAYLRVVAAVRAA